MSRKANFVITTLKVRGSGEFPFDMLRYDQCVPKTEEDSYLLGSSHPEMRTVTLRRFCPNGRAATAARWNSFGWAVVEETGAEP